MRFSKLEKVFIIKEYEVTRNASEVKRRFTRNFRRPGPDQKTVIRISKNFTLTGSTENRKGTGRPRLTRNLRNQHVSQVL